MLCTYRGSMGMKRLLSDDVQLAWYHEGVSGGTRNVGVRSGAWMAVHVVPHIASHNECEMQCLDLYEPLGCLTACFSVKCPLQFGWFEIYGAP